MTAGASVVLAQRIDPDAGGVDDAAGLDADFAPGFHVARHQPHGAARVVQHVHRFTVVDQQRAVRRRRAGNGQRQAGVVELAVPVFDAALQPPRLGAGQQAQRFGAAQPFGTAQAGLAGQRVVHLQAGAVERRFPQLVRGHDEGQRLRKVRRAAQDVHALVQRLAHQVDVALRQVAHAAMHQFGGARAGALGEVVCLDQHHAVAALGRVQRHAQASGAAADDGDVVLARFGQARQQRGAVGEQGCGHGRSGLQIRHRGRRGKTASI